jgi:hypothetical protein
MSGPEFLLGRVGHLKSRLGGFVPGSHVAFRGEDLHRDLADAEWIDLYLFGITGRRHSPAQLRLLQTIWTFTSYPDARLWNNRVAALAGSARSTGNLGVAAALAVSEATIYGRGVDIRAITFLQRTRRTVDAGGSIADCVQQELDTHRSLAGYGRPLVSRDERVEPIMTLARQLGLESGRHIGLAHEIDDYLARARWRLRMNYAAVAAALASDIGFSPREYYHYLFPAFLAGMQPCYIEALGEAEGSLFPLPCTEVRYLGHNKRAWAAREDSGRA